MILSNLLLVLVFVCSAVYVLGIDAYSFQYDKYIRFHWKGALTSSSIIIKTFPWNPTLKNSGYNTFLGIYTKSGSSIDSVSQVIKMTFSSEAYSLSDLSITGLTPLTKYYYCYVFASASSLTISDFQGAYGLYEPVEFDFTTFSPALTPHNFTFGAASCAKTGSNHPVFAQLARSNFDFFIHMGDLHYEDITKNDVNQFYNAYFTVFSQSNQRQFFQSTPIQYMFDDHDFGSNDADGNVPSKPAATAAFRKFAPSYPLKNYLPADDSTKISGAPQGFTNPINYLSYNEGKYGIFRSFIVGRCLFIMMDLRSFQDVLPEDILGDEQKNWLENQIRYAGNTDGIRQVILVSGVPWVAEDGGVLKETTVWDDFHPTQAMVASLVNKYIYHNNKNIMLIAGDAHMIALDDGRNNVFGGFPVVQAASLDRRGSCKGGPYSHGYHTGNDHFGIFEVTDYENDTICVKIGLMDGTERKIAFDTCRPDLYPSDKNHKCGISWRGWLIIFGPIVFFFIVVGLVLWYRRSRRKNLLAKKKKKQEEAQQKELQRYSQDAFYNSEIHEKSGGIEEAKPNHAPPSKIESKTKLEVKKTNDASGQDDDSMKIKSERDMMIYKDAHLSDLQALNGQWTPKGDVNIEANSPMRRNIIPL